MGILNNFLDHWVTKSQASCGRFSRKVVFTSVLISIGQLISSANAQELDKQWVKVGETRVIPELRLDYVSVDNAFYDSSNPVESTGILLSPSVTWEADRRLLKLSAAYSGVYGNYSESNLNFNDHDITFRIDAARGARHRAFGEFTIEKTHENLGTGQTTFTPNVTEQVESTRVGLNAGYTFGVASAKGNVGVGLIVGTQTFNDVATITEGDDNSEITPYVFFSYRLSPDTRFVTEASFKLTDYDEDRRDRTEIGTLVGLDMAATARTGGSLRFGVSQADFDVAGVSDTSQVISDVNLYFRPRSYSRFDLVFSRRFVTVDNDDTGAGASLVNSGRLSWRHAWSSRFSTLASLGLTQNERNCPNNDTASNSAGIAFNVEIKRWLTVGAGVTSVSRTVDLCDSTLTQSDFDAEGTTLGFHVIGSL